MLPAYPFTQVQFASAVLLILLAEVHQRQIKFSPLTTSETFTLRRFGRISAGSSHSKGSVNGASDALPLLVKSSSPKLQVHF